MPAAFEGATPFEFEILVDFGAYRDIGRHRKGYQQQQVLTVDHGFLVPPLLTAFFSILLFFYPQPFLRLARQAVQGILGG